MRCHSKPNSTHSEYARKHFKAGTGSFMNRLTIFCIFFVASLAIGATPIVIGIAILYAIACFFSRKDDPDNGGGEGVKTDPPDPIPSDFSRPRNPSNFSRGRQPRRTSKPFTSNR
jgi:hypothetical protein